MTATEVLKINNRAIDDFSHNKNFEEIIEMREDIIIACKQLNIETPFCVTEAKTIADYLNKIYHRM